MAAEPALNDEQLRTILVGIEDPPACTTLIRAAARLAETIRARLVVVRVVRQQASLQPEIAALQASLADDVAAQTFADTVEALSDSSVVWEVATVQGSPASMLAAIAADRHVDAIVVGGQAAGWRHRLRRLLTGSVATRLACLQPAPVIVVPAATSHPRARRNRSGRTKPDPASHTP